MNFIFLVLLFLKTAYAQNSFDIDDSTPSRRSSRYSSPKQHHKFSTFIPVDPNSFPYHFIPYDNYPYAQFYPNDERFSSSRVETLTPSPEPIFYKYSPQDDSSEESVLSIIDFSDYTIFGVENLVFLGNIPEGNHITVLIKQGSDGQKPIFVDDDVATNERRDRFPFNLEVRVFSDESPNDEFLDEIKDTAQTFLKDNGW